MKMFQLDCLNTWHISYDLSGKNTPYLNIKSLGIFPSFYSENIHFIRSVKHSAYIVRFFLKRYHMRIYSWEYTHENIKRLGIYLTSFLRKKKLLIIILKDSAYVMSYSENKYLLNTQQVARPILKNTPYQNIKSLNICRTPEKNKTKITLLKHQTRYLSQVLF